MQRRRQQRTPRSSGATGKFNRCARLLSLVVGQQRKLMAEALGWLEHAAAHCRLPRATHLPPLPSPLPAGFWMMTLPGRAPRPTSTSRTSSRPPFTRQRRRQPAATCHPRRPPRRRRQAGRAWSSRGPPPWSSPPPPPSSLAPPRLKRRPLRPCGHRGGIEALAIGVVHYRFWAGAGAIGLPCHAGTAPAHTPFPAIFHRLRCMLLPD